MLRARAIRKAFDGRPVLRGLDLDVAAGTTVALLGGNGAGKSTLLRVLAAVARPDAGALTLGTSPEVDALRQPHVARHLVRLVAQDAPAFGELTVAEHAALDARCRGRPAPTPAALEAWGVARLGRRRVADLSRGQRQRLALCDVWDAPILLLDEPHTALDADGQRTLDEALAARRGRLATALALHDEALARRHADVVLRLRDGRLEAA